jgi:MtN3 and saliva related transmembrane protein
MNLTGVIGIVAGVLTSASLLPQLIKIIKEKKVEDLSLVMFLSLMVGQILWMVYGVMKSDMPIIFTNGFSILLNAVILFFRHKYKNKPAMS